MATAGNSGPWSGSVLAWSLRVLAITLALRLAVGLLVAILPVVIGVGIVVALVYVVYAINKVRRSRW